MKLALDELDDAPRYGDGSRAPRWWRAAGSAAVASFLARRVTGLRAARSCRTPHRRSACARAAGSPGASAWSATDVLGARKRSDGVARAAWPIELWEAGQGGARYEYGPDGDWYDVPRGCLEHATCTNLLAAGRCMAASHEAMGSARVIGTCLAVGRGRRAPRGGARPMNLVDLLAATAERYGARAALTELASGRTLDYAALHAGSRPSR